MYLFLCNREQSNTEQSLDRRKEIAAAIAYWSEVIQQDPTWAAAYCCRGDVYRRISQFNKAIADYSEALRLDPKLVRAYCGRADAYEGNAFGVPSHVIDDDPQAHDVALPPQIGEFDKAIADYSKALLLDPKNAIALFGRGHVHMMKNEREKSIHDYSESIRIDPSFARAYYFRGVMYEQNGEQEKAQADYSTADRLHSGSMGRRPEFKVGESEADLFFRVSD